MRSGDKEVTVFEPRTRGDVAECLGAVDYYEVFVRDTELMLDGRARAGCLRQLYQRRQFRGPDRLYLLCRDLLTFGDTATASEVFADLFSVNPEFLRQSHVWNADRAGHLRDTGLRLLRTFVQAPQQDTNFAYAALGMHLGADSGLSAEVFQTELIRRRDFLSHDDRSDQSLLSALSGALFGGVADYLRLVQPHLEAQIAARISLLLAKMQ